MHPSGHIRESETNLTYAVCDGLDCDQTTCCSCKMLLANGNQGHVCKVDDEEQKFKEMVEKRGFKECSVCGATIELAEGELTSLRYSAQSMLTSI